MPRPTGIKQCSDAVPYIVSRAHLVSIGIKSEDSILLKESVICGHRVWCGLRTSCYLEAGNTCVALL